MLFHVNKQRGRGLAYESRADSAKRKSLKNVDLAETLALRPPEGRRALREKPNTASENPVTIS